MFKKLLVVSAILAASSTVALASVNSAPAPYVGGSIGLTDNSAKGHGTYRGLDANLALGYGGIVQQAVYVAGELFVVPGSISVGPSDTVKTSYSVGASILPGIMLNDKTMGYLRLGIVDSRFTDSSQTKVGGQVGLGLETNLCQNWDLRGEYTWSKYASSGRLTSPTTDGAHIGIVYRFE